MPATQNVTNATIKSDIRTAVQNLLNGNERMDSGRFNLLQDYEIEDLKEYMTRIDAQTGDIDIPMRIICTIVSLANENRVGGPRRITPKFLSDFEDAVFYSLSQHYFKLVLKQGKTKELDQMYEDRHIVL